MLLFRRIRRLQPSAAAHASGYNLFNIERSLAVPSTYEQTRPADLAERPMLCADWRTASLPKLKQIPIRLIATAKMFMCD
jgi:hypothetical protein